MRKIANTNELQAQLRKILAYSQTEHPSRRRVAAELNDLAARIAGEQAKSADYKELNLSYDVRKNSPEALVANLNQAAENMFWLRGTNRIMSDVLGKIKGDATGTGPLSFYPDNVQDQVATARDSWYDLDHAIGKTAREFEYLAKLIRQSKPKPPPGF